MSEERYFLLVQQLSESKLEDCESIIKLKWHNNHTLFCWRQVFVYIIQKILQSPYLLLFFCFVKIDIMVEGSGDHTWGLCVIARWSCCIPVCRYHSKRASLSSLRNNMTQTTERA
jgi:hypothetical protein